MSDIKIIAFDADDTLWVNEYHYHKAEHLFAQMMSRFTSPEEARGALLRKEKENLPLLGYGSKPFIISLVETAIELSNGSVSTDEITQIIEIGKNTIGQKIELMPNVVDVLEKLYGRVPLVLATKGDLKEQESKIERSGLGRYFSAIKIMSEKNTKSYQEILYDHKIEPHQFLMVGNSFKSDILPVLELGGYAIYIPAEITWEHEIVEEREHPNLLKADSLSPDLFTALDTLKLRDMIPFDKNRSYRRFYEEVEIPESELLKMIDAARLSPSSRNIQPIKYFISAERGLNEKIFKTLAWAGYLKDWDGPCEGERPSAYIIQLHDKVIAPGYSCDHGITAQSILLQAVDSGFGGCIIASVKREELAQIIGLGERYDIIQVIALGKPKEIVVIDEIKDNDYKYWRESSGTHHVPKRGLDELIVGLKSGK